MSIAIGYAGIHVPTEEKNELIALLQHRAFAKRSDPATRRVVLLGPPTYPRYWSAQRTFNRLRAQLHIEITLSNDEVINWLERMASAKSGQDESSK